MLKNSSLTKKLDKICKIWYGSNMAKKKRKKKSFMKKNSIKWMDVIAVLAFLIALIEFILNRIGGKK